MTAYSNVLEMIGNTPMMEARKLDAGPCRLFLKLENQNPGGSIKDRIALSMIEAAERDRKIVLRSRFLYIRGREVDGDLPILAIRRFRAGIFYRRTHTLFCFRERFVREPDDVKRMETDI